MPILIGGIDVAFPIDPNQQAIDAVYVILSYPTLLAAPTAVYRSHKHFTPPPYISSYLSFRESSTLLSLISEQLETRPQLHPGVIMIDGNGSWHQRRAGLACFIGQCGIPCIGVGKTWYHLNGVDLDVKKQRKRALLNGIVYMREQKVLYVVDMLFLIRFHSKILHQADAVKTSFCGIRSGNTNG